MWLGYLFLIIILAISCKYKEDKKLDLKELRLSKTLPSIFKKVTDSLFKIKQDTVFYNGKYFTGYTYSIFENGDISALNGYFNGVEEGVQKTWYPNGLLAEKRFYINGKKEGINEGWWADGKSKFYYTAFDNSYNGEFKEWYATGILAKHFNYKIGQEEGSQKLWWDNGTVRANYVIRGGKKYGLIGLKICVNPYDSIAK